MLLLGLIVVAHGVGLLIGCGDRLGGASRPLMIVYAVLMLASGLIMSRGSDMDVTDGM